MGIYKVGGEPDEDASAALDFKAMTTGSRQFLPNMIVAVWNCCEQATTVIKLLWLDRMLTGMHLQSFPRITRRHQDVCAWNHEVDLTKSRTLIR